MYRFPSLFCFLILFLASFSLSAQQSSKTKAANKLYEKGTEIKVTNVTAINSSGLEFSPSYYLNGIVYSSSRLTQGARDENIDETFFELFYSELDANGEPLRPREFSLELNSPLHEGPVTFSRNGDQMYFTRNNTKKGLRQADEQGVTRLKIYEARKGRMDWENVMECSFNSDDYSTCHPTLSADGMELYFSSDMEGGYGGMDLYKVVRTGDGWSEPVNLGSAINTEKNELFPFIHSSGHLFFASNGYEGVGALDLYMVAMEGKNKDKVINLGAPFNSEEDDLGLILNPEGTQGFFSSSREGGVGKDDIYRFNAPKGIWGATRPAVFPTTIRVMDAKSKVGLKDAEIRVFERSSDGFISGGKDLYEAVLIPSKEGEGELVFQLVRRDAASLGEADRISDTRGEAVYDFTGERKFLVLVSKSGYDTKEAGYSTMGNAARSELVVPMAKRTCALLSGMIKDKATGGRIPNAVVRIQNTCNDREEVILATELGTFNHCLPLGCEFKVIGVKENYQKTLVGLSTKDNNGSTPLEAELLMSADDKARIGKGSVIVLENIYYDFDKSDIRAGAARELDKLSEILLAHPTMEIEMVAHTDSRGSGRYNQQLSQRRAESARQYLVARGVESRRIQAIGIGETHLRNRCKDGVPCSEKEHQYNRRSEVRVIRMDEPMRIRPEE